MGAFLEKPKTEKTSSHGEGYGVRYAFSAMQGWRMEMEDAHVSQTNFKLKNWSFFGVFDGHAGPLASQYSSQHVLETILNNLPTDDTTSLSMEDVKKAMEKGFVDLDKQMKREPKWEHGEDHSGTTAITVMISPTHIIWANCGDSRGIHCQSGKLKFATEDHKPYNMIEKNRIEKAGGTVMMQRVNGSLAVSRALGDFDYKRNDHLKPEEQLVSPAPDVTEYERNNEEDEFLLLACDGIYDVMTSEEVIDYVRYKLCLTEDLESICSDLIDNCLNKNSRDNMTVILITLPGAPKVSEDAIEEEKKLQQQARDEIKNRITNLVESAQDVLEVEENYVMQQLTTDLPANYDVTGKRQFISELLHNLVKDKFPGDGMEDFSGPSDSSSAPREFTVMTQERGEIHISSIMEQDTDIQDPLLLNSNVSPVLAEEEQLQHITTTFATNQGEEENSSKSENMEIGDESNNSDKLPQEEGKEQPPPSSSDTTTTT